MCSECESYRELARALGDHRRHDAEDPDRRERERDHREDSEQRGAEALLRERAFKHRLHRANGAERLIGIERNHRALERRWNVGGVVARPNHERQPWIRRLVLGQVHRRRRVRVEREATYIADHADDLSQRIGIVARGHSHPDRIPPGPILLGERLVHDHHGWRCRIIRGGEQTPYLERNFHHRKEILRDDIRASRRAAKEFRRRAARLRARNR